MRNRKGFTLIELLVVVAIIGVLAALVIVNLNTAQRRSRDTRRKADLAQIRTALEMYYDENLDYPSSADDAAIPVLNPPTSIASEDAAGSAVAAGTAFRTVIADQMTAVPDDPRNGADATDCEAVVGTPAGTPPVPVNHTFDNHYYYYGSDGNDFNLVACLEAPRDGEDEGYHLTNSN